MRNTFLIFAVTISTFIFASCKKNTTANTNNTNNNTSTTFSWSENGGATMNADSAKWTTGGWGTGIRAWQGGTAYFFEINWDTQNNTSVGSKALTVPFGVTMIKNSTSYAISSASTLNITSFSNGKMSGDFTSATANGANTINLSCTFTNLPQY